MTRWAILLLACALATACGPDTVPTPSTTPRSTEAAPSIVAPSAAAVHLDWTLATLPDTRGPWSAGGVITDANWFVVYGGVNDQPAAWSSLDGLAWTSAALPGLRAPQGGLPAYAAASNEATVLIGVGGTDECAHPSREYIWRRAHGDDAWTAAPFVEELFCQGGLPKVAANNSGFAVAGTNAGEIPFAWHSVEGLSWTAVGGELPVDAPPALLTATHNGFLLLGRGVRASAATSVDGLLWTAVEGPPVPPAFNPSGPGMSPEVLIDTASGPLAIYESEDGRTASAWQRRSDGSWAELTMAGLPAPGGRVSAGVTIGDRTFLFLIAGGRGRLVMSTDLDMWAEIAIPPLASVNALAELDGRFVLVGSVIGAAGEPTWQVWVADDPAPGG